MANRRDSKDRESRPKVQEIVIAAEFCSNGVEIRNFIGQGTHGHSYCMMIMTMCCRLLPNPFKASLGKFLENLQHRQPEVLFQYPQRFKDF